VRSEALKSKRDNELGPTERLNGTHYTILLDLVRVHSCSELPRATAPKKLQKVNGSA
jgi:hypothetical protein